MDDMKERILQAKRLNQVDQTLIELLNDIQMEFDNYEPLKGQYKAVVEDNDFLRIDLNETNREIKDLRNIIKRSKHKYAQVNILIEQLHNTLDK